MKRKIIFLLLCSIVLTLFPCYAEETTKEQTKDTPGTAIFVMAVPVEIQVEENAHVQDAEKWHVQLSYPVLNGLSDKKAEKKINQILKKHGQDLQKKLVKQAKHTKSKTKYELISQYRIKETKSPYFLISFFDYQYEGGAHGITSYSYLTLDLRESRILTLDQLFDKEVDYKEALQTLLMKQIEERTDAKVLLQDEIYAHLQIQDQQNFYIKPNGDLVLVFNVQEVSPYTSGIMEFVLTLESLRSVSLPLVF